MITTNPGGSLVASGTDGQPSVSWQSRQSRAWWLAAGAVAVMLGLTYAPNFKDLFESWSDDPNYSHGFLVIPIALFILWRRLSDMPWERSRDEDHVPWWSWAILAAVMAVRGVAYEESMMWVETVTLLPTIFCLTWSFGGAPLLRRAWPAILFLIFMLPLPNSINGLIALPLQRLAATGSYYILQLTGFWAIQQGNVISLKTSEGMEKLDVALACNGLKMLMTLAATVTATVMLLPLPNWKRIVLMAERRTHRHDQQHDPNRDDRMLLLLYQGRSRPRLGARHIRLADDAAGAGTGGIGAADPDMAGPREGRGRGGKPEVDPPDDQGESGGHEAHEGLGSRRTGPGRRRGESGGKEDYEGLGSRRTGPGECTGHADRSAIRADSLNLPPISLSSDRHEIRANRFRRSRARCRIEEPPRPIS